VKLLLNFDHPARLSLEENPLEFKRIYGFFVNHDSSTVSAKRSPFMKWFSREARYSEMKKAKTKGARSEDIDSRQRERFQFPYTAYQK